MDLAQIVAERAKVAGDLVKVDHFLNHRVDPSVLERIGSELAERIAPWEPDLLVTPETSGIPPAAAVSLASGIPFVYARKRLSPTGLGFERPVYSRTHQRTYTLWIGEDALAGAERMVVIDDFLSHGSAATSLIDIGRDAGVPVVGVAVVIEKSFESGRKRLADLGIEVTALVEVASIRPVLDVRPGS
jgi:xanthine phosphoribosyltransferase